MHSIQEGFMFPSSVLRIRSCSQGGREDGDSEEVPFLPSGAISVAWMALDTAQPSDTGLQRVNMQVRA